MVKRSAIISLTALSRSVQLMIFVMAGGAGNQNNKNTMWQRNVSRNNNKRGRI